MAMFVRPKQSMLRHNQEKQFCKKADRRAPQASSSIGLLWIVLKFLTHTHRVERWLSAFERSLCCAYSDDYGSDYNSSSRASACAHLHDSTSRFMRIETRFCVSRSLLFGPSVVIADRRRSLSRLKRQSTGRHRHSRRRQCWLFFH